MTQIAPQSPIPAPSGGGCGRWIVGCGATLLVFLAVAGGAAWWFVGRPVVAAFQSMTQIERMGPLEERVADRRPFVAPADGLLSEDQVQRFVAAQGQLQRDLGSRVERLERLVDEFDGRRPDAFELLFLAETYTELMRLLGEVLNAQADALDAHGFSAGEYVWVRWEVLRAAGVAGAAYDPDGLAGAFIGESGTTAGPRPATDGVPDANRRLVERYREVLNDVALLAPFGL